MNHISASLKFSPELAFLAVVIAGLIACLVAISGFNRAHNAARRRGYWGGL